MRDRYPISGIKQSYRATPERRTVIIPLAIMLLLGGLIAFFFLGKTPPGMVQEEIVSVAESGLESSAEKPIEEMGGEREREMSFSASGAGAGPGPEVSPLLEERPDAKRGKREPSVTVFTEWMSPLALDSYIRKKNEGFEETFWKRGHWITAVEGRWKDGTHEFRIAYERIPDARAWQWQYRANQTPEQFHKNALELRAQGFELVQSQAFDHPDQRKRYQAVWQREIPRAKVVKNTSPQAAIEAEAMRVATAEEAGDPAAANFVPVRASDSPPSTEIPRLMAIQESQAPRPLPFPKPNRHQANRGSRIRRKTPVPVL